MLSGEKVAAYLICITLLVNIEFSPLFGVGDPNVRLITAARCRSFVLACLLVYLLFTVHKQLAEYKFWMQPFVFAIRFFYDIRQRGACFKGIFRQETRLFCDYMEGGFIVFFLHFVRGTNWKFVWKTSRWETRKQKWQQFVSPLCGFLQTRVISIFRDFLFFLILNRFARTPVF